MSNSFNLNALIREVIDTSTLVDPDSLAKEVGKRIGRNQERDALQQALPALVMTALSRGRHLTSSGGHQPTGTQRRNAVGRSNSAPGRSSKVAGIREAWRKMLQEPIAVGGNHWKRLAECNAEDLTYAEDLRRAHAARTAAAADKLANLRELLQQHGVATVGDLPDQTLGHALGEAA